MRFFTIAALFLLSISTHAALAGELRNSKERRQATNVIREVTGWNPQTLEQFFRANAKSIGGAGQ